MPFTHRDYPRFRFALGVQDHAPNIPNQHERSLCGDIIAAMPLPKQGHGEIGSKEATKWIWLDMEGLDSNELWPLHHPNDDPFDPDGVETSTAYDKRRYCIPFVRLKKIYPSFNIARAMDTDDIYQPFIMIDDVPNFDILKKPRVFDVHGLVFDKVTGRYL